MLPPTLWIPGIATGVMLAAHRVLMRGEPKEARTPLWKYSIVMCSGLFTIFCLGSVVHGSLPFITCVIIAVFGSAILGTVSWLIQRRLEDVNGGWR